MPRGLVLVIEQDEWLSRLLDGAIREAGYDVVVCGTAQAGLDAAVARSPDCIVCDVDLPDDDGYAVARQVRTHPSRVSVTPFLFLSGLDDEESRIEGFHVGADVYITKPFRVDEVVAQIDALVQMATRLRARRDSMLSMPPGPPGGTAIEGDLEQMSIATVLTVLEMERRSGTFDVVSKKRRAQLDILGGSVMEGTVGGTKVSALAALRTMLAWTVGRFSFVPGPPREVPLGGSNKSLGAFLIEALRLEDEATRAELELPPSRRRANDGNSDHEGLRKRPRDLRSDRAPGPVLGGPASSPADFAPPSTRAPRVSELSLALESELSDWEIPSEASPTRMEPVAFHTAIPAPPRTPANPRPPPPSGDTGIRRVPTPATPAVRLGPPPMPGPRMGGPPMPPVAPRLPPRPTPPRPTPAAEKKRG